MSLLHSDLSYCLADLYVLAMHSMLNQGYPIFLQQVRQGMGNEFPGQKTFLPILGMAKGWPYKDRKN